MRALLIIKKPLLGLLFLASAVFAGNQALPGQASAVSAAADGCDSYAIMRCGANSPEQFINKARANAPGDLKAIYRDYGLVPSEYDRFMRTAKQGTLYNDGRIMVDGTVVGHSNLNVGRVQDANFNQKVSIEGKNYWGGPFGSTYHANRADVMVMFNDRGVMEFAVISSCGNPQRITPNKPEYSCDNLRKQAVEGKTNTWRFTTKASASQGATVVKAVYDFGDGQTQTVTDLGQPVEHSFTKSSTITVKVHIKLPGGNVVIVDGADCVTQVEFKKTETPPPPPPPANPYAKCLQLTGVLTDQATRTYRFTATADFDASGTTFNGADFDFGDGIIMRDVAVAGKDAIVNHGYAKEGTYTTTATLKFSVNGAATSVQCQFTINPTDQPKECKPGIPEGDARCDDNLLITGPAAVAGVFGGIGTLAGVGHHLWRKRFLGF